MTIFFLFNERRSDTLKTLQSLRKQEGLDKIVVLQPSALDAEQKIDDQQDELIVVEEVAVSSPRVAVRVTVWLPPVAKAVVVEEPVAVAGSPPSKLQL